MRKIETVESLEKTIVDCEYNLANLSKLDFHHSYYVRKLQTAKMKRILLIKRENKRV